MEPLVDLGDCARVLGLAVTDLVELAKVTDDSYTRRVVQRRAIEEPLSQLKLVQRRVHHVPLKHESRSPLTKARRQRDAAKLHVGMPWVARVDIRSFYPSVSFRHVEAALRMVGCSPEVSDVLTRLCTYRGRLPTGAPTSGTLAALVLHPLDEELYRLAIEQGVAATRWGDDYVFSAGSRAAVGRLVDQAIRGIHKLGLRLNRDKVEILPASRRQSVLGLSVNRRINATKDYRRRLRDELRRARRYGVTSSRREQLAGKIGWVRHANPELARRFQHELASCPVLET